MNAAIVDSAAIAPNRISSARSGREWGRDGSTRAALGSGAKCNQALSRRRRRPISRGMRSEPDFIRFASDATILGLWGGALLGLSLLALLGERRRRRRKRIDAVGWMPWRDLSAFAAMAGLILMAMAVSGWMQG